MRRTRGASWNSRRNRGEGQSPSTFVAASFMVVLASLATLRCQKNEATASNEPPPIEIKAVVQPAQSMVIAAQIDGVVESMEAREGARVSAGQELARLGNPAVEREAVSSAAQLEWLDARAYRTPRPGTRTAAPSATDDIPARILEVRRQRFEKMKALRKSGDITERELEQAEVEYLAAKREYDLVRHTASPGALPATGEDRELLRIEREKALADQRFATQRKELLRIVSPLGGVITGVHAAKGQAIFPRDPIAEVADVTTLQVRGDVAPELMRYLRPGMPVNVRIFSVPTRAFSDEIEYVVPVQGAGSSSRAGTVVVTIPNPDGALQPNTQALITLRSLR